MDGQTLFESIRGLATLKSDASDIYPTPDEILKSKTEVLILPITEFLSPILPPINATKEEISHHSVYKPNPVFIKTFGATYKVMTSKEKPKKITIKGSNEKDYLFLLKKDSLGDASKEAKFITWIETINQILKQDKECAKRKILLQTYKIVPLSSSTSIIEWIMNTETVRSIVQRLWAEKGIEMDIGRVNKLCAEAGFSCRDTQYGRIWHKIKQEAPPVLYQWFFETFPTGDDWYNAKLAYIRTCAAWSMVGYIIGLGDRHSDNMLLNKKTGELIHIDFDCIFDKGTALKVPEIVPFRLTTNYVDAFGIFQEKTEFTITCNLVLKALYKNRESIITNLDSFIHDPLFEAAINTPVNPKIDIPEARAKLDECAKGTKELVERLICNARNENALIKMYVGWMPWV